MNKTVYKWLIGLTVAVGMAACDELDTPNIDDMLSGDTPEEMEASVGDALAITEYKFSDDYKEMTLSAQLTHDVGGYDLADSTQVIAKPLLQVQLLPKKYSNESQPIITEVINSSREALGKQHIKLLVLVDLSLPQKQIDEERKAVKEIKALFGSESLQLAFMHGDNVSETFEGSDYILDNYFVHKDSTSVYLYRAVLTKLAEFQDPKTTLGSARHKVMVILSGGKTYVNDQPVDPQHFEFQQRVADKAAELKGHLLVYYANYAASNDIGDGLMALSDQTNDTNIMQYICKDMNGLYQTRFNWQTMVSDILKDLHIDLSNYKIVLEFPDRKVFRGNLHQLQITFYDKTNDDLVAKGSTLFSLGTVYNPVIVRDNSLTDIIIEGVLTTIGILLLVWLVLQFLEPFIRYQVFKHKYVLRYSGSKMSVQGLPVSESCYLCKAPFQSGDEVVVKCKHTMHKDCWDDNEYHCPEYGRHCQEGSHFYNLKNLFDSRNALFYKKWVLMAIVAGFLAWCISCSHNHPYSTAIIQYLNDLIYGAKPGSNESGQYLVNYGAHLSDLPAFGLSVGFLLTLCLSLLTVRRRQWLPRMGEILLRSVIAAIVGSLCCIIGCLISIAFHLESATFLVDWIPWALLSCVIILAVTIKTRTTLQRSFWITIGLISVLSMFMWAFVYYNPFMDYRLSLHLSFMVYAVAIAVGIASVTPRSERFFLHVEGAIKEMDIALYKWLRVAPDRSVTIGKSVDCSIQLSWDVNGNVSPVHAEIRPHRGSLRLTALEEGVLIGDRPLAPGEEEWLYHGRKFTIGNTTFTYIEKDL